LYGEQGNGKWGVPVSIPDEGTGMGSANPKLEMRDVDELKM
jgi:hypothetical protein